MFDILKFSKVIRRKKRAHARKNEIYPCSILETPKPVENAKKNNEEPKGKDDDRDLESASKILDKNKRENSQELTPVHTYQSPEFHKKPSKKFEQEKIYPEPEDNNLFLNSNKKKRKNKHKNSSSVSIPNMNQPLFHQRVEKNLFNKSAAIFKEIQENNWTEYQENDNETIKKDYSRSLKFLNSLD